MPTPIPAHQADDRAVSLRDGTRAVIRPIRRDGGPTLADHLKRLSPESRYQRFFSAKREFAPDELVFLTHPDGINHLALVLAILDAEGREKDSVGVARCVRDPQDPATAEAAVAVMDEWQGRGIGRLLLKALAADAYRAGIRHWRGTFLSDNIAVRKILEGLGSKEWEEATGHGIIEVVYRLAP